MWHIAAFYRFAEFANFADFRTRWYGEARKRRIKGTILLAAEGVNGTLAVPEAPDQLAGFLRDVVGRVPGFDRIEAKWSQAAIDPFRKLKVRLKQEIVTLGVPNTRPSVSGGERVGVARWNALLADPSTLVIDTRNDYEVALGSFEGALNPKTASFRDFPAYVGAELHHQKDRPIALFCTGGIRCEKASAYLRDQGFDQVYQLSGGVLAYLAEVEPDQSKWRGDCFVFDDRVALTADLEPSGHGLCSACRQPISAADRADDRYQPGVSCPHCYAIRSEAAKASSQERYRQMVLAAERGEQHLKRE